MGKRKTVVHICSFDETGDLRGKALTYERVKAIVLAAGRFSCFEASDTPKRAEIFTRLCRDPELVITTKDYPWTYVALKKKAP